MHVLKLVFLAAAAALASPAALGFDCGDQRIAAVVNKYRAMYQPSIPDAQMDGMRMEIAVAAKHCPETGWIQIIAAGAEIKGLERYEAANRSPAEEAKRDLFAYVERAVGHVFAFRDHYPDDFRHGAISLRYDEWFELIGHVVNALVRYADQGFVHPLVSETPPLLPCDRVSRAMATKASNFRLVRSPASLRLLTLVAEACRTSPERTDWSVLAQRAYRLVSDVENGTITEPEAIRWALREAYRDSRHFLDGRNPPSGVWFDSHERKLQQMLAQHPVSLRFFDDTVVIDRADWFRPEHIGQEATIYSIALTLSEAWSPRAAGITDATKDEVTRVRGAFMVFAYEIGKEADAAGQGKAGKAMIAEALTAFQEGLVRTPETADLPGAPDWLFRIIHGALTKEDTPAQ